MSVDFQRTIRRYIPEVMYLYIFFIPSNRMVPTPAETPEVAQQLFVPVSRVSLFTSGACFPYRLCTSLFIHTQYCKLSLCPKSHLGFCVCVCIYIYIYIYIYI
jgi:hypothetical protein